VTELDAAGAVATASPALLDVDRLSVEFQTLTGTVTAVRDVSLRVAAGECLAIVGESGSGKSVTARSLVGLAGGGARVCAERMRFETQNLLETTDREWRRLRGRRIGFVFQDALTSLDPLRRIGDEVAEPLEIHGVTRREHRRSQVVELLEQVGVPEPAMRAEQYPHELSGGLRQRALIASALAAGPSLLIADEPTTALDATVQAQVLELLALKRNAGLTLIVISHDLSVVARIADRVAVMYAGMIVEQGPVGQLLSRPTHPYTAALLAAAPSYERRSQAIGAAPLRPSSATSTSGCPYSPRCVFGDVRCTESIPPTQDACTGRTVRCWHPLRSPGLESAGRTPPPRATVSGAVIVDVAGVSKQFRSLSGDRRTAVDAVSFELHAGEALGIVGESGSGKSTTAQIVLGLLAPDAGEVCLAGRSWSALPEGQRRLERHRIQTVQQDPLSSFDPRFTVERIVGEALGHMTGRRVARDRQRVIELLTLVGLDEHFLTRRPHKLSGGERQRVAIARALATDPEVLVCDEPVSALDVSVQAQLLRLFERLRTEFGLALLFISHDLAVIHEICDRVIVMKDGRIIETGSAERIFAAPEHPYTRQLLDAARPPEAAAPVGKIPAIASREQ
jgi:peptide/nickel transport system ATP-binding protein